MTLTERIQNRKQTEKPQPIREPEWLRRMREQGLPPKDLTERAA